MTLVDYDAIYARLEFVPHRCPQRRTREFAEQLDPGIREAVLILNWHRVDTYQSCEGGQGHAYPEPTIDIGGGEWAGWAALPIALTYGLPVTELRRKWRIDRTQVPIEEMWQLVFHKSIRGKP